MEIYLIRHTQTDTLNGLCYGQRDVPLADNFLEEAREVLKKIPVFQTDNAVFSSPLSRCRRLANLISDDVIFDNRLLEMNFGDWENKLFSEIEPDLLNFWTNNFVNFPAPNGESFTELCQRVEHFWNALITQETERVFIVTHAGVIRSLLAIILKLPLEFAFQFCVDYGSGHKLRYANNYAYIEFLNL